MEDQDLIEKVRGGDQAAYTEIVRKYQVRLLQLCISMLHDEKEAEDAAQEVFVKAFYALDRFQGKSSFYTWLYRIGANHCMDLARKKSRKRTVSWDQLLEEKGDKIERLLAKNPQTPQDTGERELVHHVLGLLTPDYCLILTLREIQGLSYEEMTEVLHCSLAAVKSRLKRAREDFKEKLRYFLKADNV